MLEKELHLRKSFASGDDSALERLLIEKKRRNAPCYNRMFVIGTAESYKFYGSLKEDSLITEVSLNILIPYPGQLPHA